MDLVSFFRATVAVCFILIPLAVPAPLFSQARTSKKIHVGVPAVSMGNIVIFFAKGAKLFDKHGLDAEVVVMQGSGIASRALVAGSVATSPIATPTVINAALAGSDMVILAHTMPGVVQSLIVRPDIRKRSEERRVGKECRL